MVQFNLFLYCYLCSVFSRRVNLSKKKADWIGKLHKLPVCTKLYVIMDPDTEILYLRYISWNVVIDWWPSAVLPFARNFFKWQ